MVDELPDDLIDRVGDTIQSIRSPMWRAIAAAPLDDEPELRASERRLIDERLAKLAQGGEVLTPSELAAALQLD